MLVSLGAVLIVRHAFAGPALAPLDGGAVGFADAATITLMLLALTAAARPWHELSRDPVTRLALAALAIGWAALALGYSARAPSSASASA